MAFHTIWSVDVGKSSLKAVKLRRDRNNIEIIAVDKIDYPISKNGVDAEAQSKEALSVFRARNDVRDPVVAAHPGQGTFSRFIKIPAFDEKKVRDMVGYEASQQIPFPLDEVNWAYHIIDREYLPGQEREVALFAVRREAIDDFLLDFSNEQLLVEMITIGYLGLFNFVAHDIQPDEPCIVLDVGATHTDLVLVDGRSFWIRPLPHSGNEITKAIMDRYKVSFADAEKLKIEIAKVPPQRAKQIFHSVIQPRFKDLLGEIHRSLVFYRSQAGETRFGKLFLLGNASKTIGLKKFLEEQLGLQVTRVQTINHFRIGRGVNVRTLQAHLPAFGPALGSGVQALGMGNCTVDLVPREEKLKKEVGRKKKHVFIAAGIVLCMLVVAHFMLKGKLADLEEANDLGHRGRVVMDIKEAKAEIAALQEEGFRPREDLEKDAAALRRVTVLRSGALRGLQVLEEVLASFANNPQVKLVTDAEDPLAAPEVEQRIQQYKEQDLYNMLWIPYLEVKPTLWPPEETSSSRKRQTEGVPAVEFRAFVVIKLRATTSESADFIATSFAERMEKEIRMRELSKVPDVSVAPGSELNEIIHASSGHREDEAGQAGRPFYGALATWYLVPELPPAAEGEGSEGETEGEAAR